MPDRQLLLLRGVNVSGRNRLPMAGFRHLLEELGLSRVVTYLQSGNAAFDTPPEDPLPAIAEGLKSQFGIVTPFFLLSAAAHARIVAACPFAAEGHAAPTTVHVWYLAARAVPDLAAIQPLIGTERLAITDHALYLHAPDGIGRSALAAGLERHLKVPCTARNWRTVQALEALLSA